MQIGEIYIRERGRKKQSIKKRKRKRETQEDKEMKDACYVGTKLRIEKNKRWT